MVPTHKIAFSQAVVDLIGERNEYLKRHNISEDTSCIFCGSPISAREFMLMNDGDGEYVIGCVQCGAGRERLPSVNPFMFLNTVRRHVN